MAVFLICLCLKNCLFMFVYTCRTERERGQYTVIVMCYKIYEGKEETMKSRYLGNNKEERIIIFIVWA